MLAVAGYGSRIVRELEKMLPGETILRMQPPYTGHLDGDRYLLCAGVIRPKTIREQTPEEVRESLSVNLLWPVAFMERLFEANECARVCVIGSESGYAWSHDDVYAAGKAALHRYVETRKLKPQQQLACIAPSIIADAGMTLRRKDRDSLAQRSQQHPKQRFLTSAEVARAIHFVLYQDEGYYTGQVMRLNGGA